MKISIRVKLVILAVVILAGNGFLGYSVYKSHQKLYDSQEWVEHTKQVISLSNKILSLGKDIESAARGFVITNDSDFLAPLYPGKQIVLTDMRQLKQLTRDNFSQQQRADSLSQYMAGRVAFSLHAVKLRRTEGLASATAYISTKRGQYLTDRVQSITQSMQQEESTLLAARKHTNERSLTIFNALSLATFIIMAALTIILLMASANYLLQNRQKETREQELIVANKELAFQNDEKENRSSELAVIVNDLKITEEKLIKVSNLNAFISQVNQNIVRVKDEATLFRNSCNIAVTYGKFKMAWIGLFDHATKTISLVEQCGIAQDDAKRFAGVTYDNQGPQGYVRQSGMVYINNNLYDDVSLENWKAFAATHGIQSCIVLPLRRSGKIIGTLNLYATDFSFSESAEISLLEELAADISFALDLFEQADNHAETERLVVQNEKRFRALIEKGTDMISLRSPEGKLSYVSPSLTKVLGYPIEDVLKNSIFDLIHPDDLPGLAEQTQSIVNVPGNSFFRQQRYLHKNGTWIWGEGTVTNMLSEPGIYALVSNFRDISERKNAEQHREFNENNLKALINNTNDLMWSIDRDFKLITSNRAFSEMVTQTSGSPPQEGANMLNSAMGDEQAKRFREHYERAFRGETFTEIEHIGFPVNIWSETSYYPIYKADAVIGTACFSRNITRQKEAENEIQKLNNGLEQKVAERTAELESANKELESFSYSVSHDLRAPLRIIDGYGQILIDDYAASLDEGGLNTLDVIITNAQKMGRLIDDLLAFSKLGTTEINLSFTNMSRLVREVLEDLTISGVSMPHQLKIGKLKPAHGDPSLIKQVWMNLISNAIKYSGNREQAIVEIGMKEDTPGPVYFVRDNGAGFDMKYYHKLFGVFQRLHNQQEFKGTGVGLALVQRIINRHRGTVWAESKPGEGATFYFTLPETNGKSTRSDEGA